MDWVVAVATSVGFGLLAGWIYAGFPGAWNATTASERTTCVSLVTARKANFQGLTLVRSCLKEGARGVSC
jgi:hypothetical protein